MAILKKLILILPMSFLTIVSIDRCAKEKITGNPAYFGLAVGNTRHGIYGMYESERDSIVVTCDSLTEIDGHNCYVLNINTVTASEYEYSSKQHKLYLGVSNDGLLWYGGLYCNGMFNVILDTPRLACPAKLSVGQSWGDTGRSATYIWRGKKNVIATYQASVVSKEDLVLGDKTYTDCYRVRYVLPDLLGYCAPFYAEIWYKEGLGPIKATSFRDDSTFTQPYKTLELRATNF